MEWTRSDTLALAKNSCTACHGLGLRQGRGFTVTPCNCVFRCIFRACFDRFCRCAFAEVRTANLRVEYSPVSGVRITYGRKDEEFVADFCLVSRRVLSNADHQIFRYHFLLGADWRICCRKLKMDRGTFFHAVYRIQQRLGRAFREMHPYGLFPLDEYFFGTMRNTLPPLGEPLEQPRPRRRSLSEIIPIKRKAA